MLNDDFSVKTINSSSDIVVLIRHALRSIVATVVSGLPAALASGASLITCSGVLLVSTPDWRGETLAARRAVFAGGYGVRGLRIYQ